MPRELRPFVFLVSALVIAALVLEHVNGRFWMSDFRVYWSAADALLHGRPMYGTAFGESTGFYKYAPAVAMAFVPSALLPFPIAAIIHFLLIGLALILCVVQVEGLMMRYVLGNYAPRILLRALLGLACIAVLLSRELHLGNINLWLVVLLIAGTSAMLGGSSIRAGICFGLLWLVKPYLAITLVPLAALGHWRSIRYAMATAVLLLLIPFVVLGPAHAWALHVQWLASMRAHGGYLTSPDTFTSLAGHLMEPPPWAGIAFIAAAALVLALITMHGRRTARTSPTRNANEVFDIWLAMALVPHLVITDQEHFLFSLPLVLFTLGGLFAQPRPLPLIIFLLAVLLYATRSSDLWGNEPEARWVAAGALGLGNILLMIAAWLARSQRPLRSERTPGP